MKRFLKILKWSGLGLVGLIGLAAGIFVVSGLLTTLPGEEITPAGLVRNTAFYLTMRDGVKIAVDVWLPADIKKDQRVPALIKPGRYGRSMRHGFGLRARAGLGLIDERLAGPMGLGCAGVLQYNAAGYAVVLVDVRGGGASEGSRRVVFGEDEVADMGEVIDYVVSQPWSNGRVGLFGGSYDGTLAELAAGLGHPAVRAVAPRFSMFDVQYDFIWPGGVFNRRFVDRWGELTARLDANDICGAMGVDGLACLLAGLHVGGHKPVDDDDGGEMLESIVAKRSNPDMVKLAGLLFYRQSKFGASGLSAADVSPFGKREAIEKSNVPMYVWVSWFDGGAVDGALARYRTFSNPQKLVIGPWSHGGAQHADPFLPPETPVEPSFEEQARMLIGFFDGRLKDDREAEKGISYYTLGEGRWKQAASWPPEGVEMQTWYFGPENTLSRQEPGSEVGLDEYSVDFTAGTGDLSRWLLIPADVVYPDRAEEDKKLLTYTSGPLETDCEITGNPVVTLQLSSSEPDCAVFAYLEDVGPDGRVTYLTEGILRAVHRKVSEQPPPYAQLGPYHSFKEDDLSPLEPGRAAELKFKMFATSVLVRRGHRIRIAIAGHDASWFDRYPKVDDLRFTVARNRDSASGVELPVVKPR